MTNVFYKTKMCNYKLGGSCRHGSACLHAHSQDELRSKPNFQKTKMCRRYRRGLCSDPNCSHAHGEHEMKKIDQFYKRKLCKYFFERGSCIRGPDCCFAHSEAELRGTSTDLGRPTLQLTRASQGESLIDDEDDDDDETPSNSSSSSVGQSCDFVDETTLITMMTDVITNLELQQQQPQRQLDKVKGKETYIVQRPHAPREQCETATTNLFFYPKSTAASPLLEEGAAQYVTATNSPELDGRVATVPWYSENATANPLDHQREKAEWITREQLYHLDRKKDQHQTRRSPHHHYYPHSEEMPFPSWKLPSHSTDSGISFNTADSPLPMTVKQNQSRLTDDVYPSDFIHQLIENLLAVSITPRPDDHYCDTGDSLFSITHDQHP